MYRTGVTVQCYTVCTKDSLCCLILLYPGLCEAHTGLRLMIESLFTDGQLIEGQYVEITKFKVYKVLYWKREI